MAALPALLIELHLTLNISGTGEVLQIAVAGLTLLAAWIDYGRAADAPPG